MEQLQSNIEAVVLPELEEKNIRLFIKRDDLLHPVISGNKYRKLFYNIAALKKQNHSCLVTFGGAFSNHILAAAGAGQEFGIKTIGVIRGEELGVDLDKTLAMNPTLQAAHKMGMEFYFVTRAAYREKNTLKFQKELLQKYPGAYLLPEGGTNTLAIRGCEEILDTKTSHFDVIATAVGTGGTISGIINSALPDQKVIGFPALKGDFLYDEIKANGVVNNNWDLCTDYHFGGYAKIDRALIEFMNDFYAQTEILLDPIYTGKMMYGLLDLIKKDKFVSGTKILAIHTGGLQGIAGMNTVLQKKNLPLLKDK